MDSKEKIVSVRADLEKNRLYTTVRGFLTKEDILSLPDELESEAKKLKPGYIAISDIRGYKPATEDMQNIMSKNMEAALRTGMGATIRVVDELNISQSELQELSSSKHGYKAVICKSVAEAETEAEKQEKKNK